jgi:hypothetical protein
MGSYIFPQVNNEVYSYEITIKNIISYIGFIEIDTGLKNNRPLILLRNNPNYGAIFNKIEIGGSYNAVIKEDEYLYLLNIEPLIQHIFANKVVEFRDITKEFPSTSEYSEIIFDKPHSHHRILIHKNHVETITPGGVLCVEYSKDFDANLYKINTYK